MIDSISDFETIFKEGADQMLGVLGFKRTFRLIYERAIDDGLQRLDMSYEKHPPYRPGAVAHILPQVYFVMPAINRIVLEIIPHFPSLDNDNDVTMTQYLGNLAPSSHRVHDWYVTLEHPEACIRSLKLFFDDWAAPYLEEFRTIESLTKGFERSDERLPNDRRFFIFMVAAFVVLRQPAKALEVLNTKFGRPGSRRKYAMIFDYLSKML